MTSGGMGDVGAGITFLCFLLLHLVGVGEESARAGNRHGWEWAGEEIRWLERS